MTIAAAGSGVPRLRGVSGENSIGEWPLDASRPLRIGRSRQCDVVLEDELVSRVHLEVRPLTGGGWEAVDLGSSGGTWIGRKRVSQHRLQSGDRLVVGGTALLVIDLEAAPDLAPDVVVPAPPPPPLPRSKPRPPPPPLPPPPREESRSSRPFAPEPQKPPPVPRHGFVRPAGSRSTVVWSAVALTASLAVLVGGWLLLARQRSGGGKVPVAARKKSSSDTSFSDVAARALLEPPANGLVRRTPVGSFTTTASGGRLEHALVTIELPGGALPAGSTVTVSVVDAAPAAMRDGFPVAQWGDFTPLSPILDVDLGASGLATPATVSFPLAEGALFSSLAVLSWNPATRGWDAFPARFDSVTRRAVAEVGGFGYVHLLGLATDG